MKITDDMIKKSCSSTIYKRGMEYLREGRVHMRKRSDELINAVVDGEDLYNVQVRFDDNGIEDFFCTCPYYETMGSMCKHIVATLKQRQAELTMGEKYIDENDRLAGMLCLDYGAYSNEKKPLHADFVLYINSDNGTGASYAMSIVIEEVGTDIHGIENFLDSYLKGKQFSFDRNNQYSPGETYFLPNQKKIIDILAEAYEMKTIGNSFYTKEAYQISIGERVASRIFPLLKDVEFSVVFDGMRMSDVQFAEDNPDIIVDISATDGEISLSVSDYGFALSNDGSWFLYENMIYHTDEEWRKYFMPIYRALAGESRTHISFKGNNTIMFAANVLPYIEGKHGIVTQGLDEIIVNENPKFKLYFDVDDGNITCVATVNYGSITIRLPDDQTDYRKIIVRDYVAESEILDAFSGFARVNGMFILDNDADIYDFITFELPLLSLKAEIVASLRFQNLKNNDDIKISTAVRYNEKIDLLEAGFESELSHEQIMGILNAVKLKRSFYRMEDGRFIDLLKNPKRQIFDLFDRLDFSEEELMAGKKTLPKYQALYLDALESVEHEESFKEYIEKIKNIEPTIPTDLNGILRPYQIEGIKWLEQLSSLGFGGILADDMGLGKTLQVLAFVHGKKPDGPVLVVTPSALVYNWLNEIERFIPSAKTLIIDGTKEERTRLIGTVDQYEFVITSYPVLRRDIALYSGITFKYFFIDEAQHIKNPKTMNARSVKKINAEHKFALTGTPIENSLIELWSIFDFVMQGYLYGANEFRTRYEHPIIKEEDEAASVDFKARIRPFILRRMKKDVLNELPEKIENTMYADLTAEQKKMYLSYLALAKDETASLLGEGGRGRIKILSLLMRLRQICCHPALFDEAYKKDSGKLDMLLELIQDGVDGGHRILIFSQFTSMLSIIREKLDKMGIKSFYLDGQTPSYERAEKADRFNGGERDVFLISLKAGGVGLNLTGADMVIHYDPWWNPAAMDQASDRAYRIGQTRAVQVIRLASRGTIEEKILKLQEEKRSLADDIIRKNNETLSTLTNDEIMQLFE